MNITYLMFHIVIHLCVCYTANGIREVRLTKDIHGLRVVNSKKIFSVLYSEPLQIIFEDIDAKTAKCQRATDFGVLFDSTSNNLLYHNGNTSIIIPSVTFEMSVKWNCTLTTNENSQTIYLFDIRIKEAKKIIVTIGGDIQIFSPSHELVLEYEGSTEYSCEEGDTVDLTCKNLNYGGNLRLGYYEANGTKIVETDKVQTKEPLNFRLLVREENNGTYVDCTYLSTEYQEFTYRVIFKVTNDPHRNSNFIVTVNEFRLIPKSDNLSDADFYNYKFIYGEYLEVTCELKDKTRYFNIDKGFATPRHKAIHTEDINKTESAYQFRVDTIHLDGSSIECSTWDSVKRKYLKASIKFNIDVYGDPTILGLPARDLLYQYNRNVNESVAHYLYSQNTTIPLACMTTKKILWWLHGNNMINGVVEINPSRGTRSITDIFPLDHRTIACVTVDKKRTEVIFHEKKDDGSSRTQLLYYTIISGGAVVSLLAVTAICTYYCRKKHTNFANEGKKPYQNFCDNVNPIPTVSNQLENNEYTYIKNDYNYIQYDGNASVANSIYYKTRQSQRGRSGNTENHYAEIDDIYSSKGTSNNMYQNNNPVNYSNLQNENGNGYYNLQKDTDYENTTQVLASFSKSNLHK